MSSDEITRSQRWLIDFYLKILVRNKLTYFCLGYVWKYVFKMTIILYDILQNQIIEKSYFQKLLPTTFKVQYKNELLEN